MSEIFKGFKLLFCAIGICTVNLDNSASPAAIKSLNISDITNLTNLTKAVNSTWPTSHFNLTTTLASTALFAALPATVANELQSDLSVPSASLHTSSSLGSSLASGIFSTTVPKGESYVVEIHPTSTGYAKATVAGYVSSSMTATQSFLDHSTARNHSEPTMKNSTPTSDHSNPAVVTFGSSISVPDSWATRSFSASTNTYTETGPHTPVVQSRPQKTSHGWVVSPSVSALAYSMSSRYPEPANNTSISKNSSSIAKVDASSPRQDYSAKGTNAIPTISPFNSQLASALSNVSKITRLNASTLHQDESTTGPYVTAAGNGPIHSAATHNFSDTARLNSSALVVKYTTEMPIVHLTPPSSASHIAAANDSCRMTKHGALLIRANHEGQCGVANNSENLLPSFQSSNSERTLNSSTLQSIRQGLNSSSHANISTAVVDLARQACEKLASSNGSALCNLTSDPLILFKDLKEATALFDYFGYWEDLNDINVSPDDPEIPDIHYFTMSPENIMLSRVFEWYSSWTVVRQGTPDWTEHGEWNLFYREFFGDANFKCHSGETHCTRPPPGAEEIHQRFLDNRPLARRVLFVAKMYDMMHGLRSAVDHRFETVENDFRTLISELIDTFTLQVDKDKESRCKLIHTIVEETVNIVVNTAVGVLTDGVASGMADALWDGVSNYLKSSQNSDNSLKSAIEKTTKTFWEKAEDKILEKTWNQLETPIRHIPQQSDKYLKWSGREFPYATPEDVHLRKALVNDVYKAWPRNKLSGKPSAGLIRGKVESPRIIGALKSGDSLCAGFEGDWQNLNPQNIKIAEDRMSDHLRHAREQVADLFREITQGAAPELGAPSMTARWMLARTWVGEKIQGTVEYDLNNKNIFDMDFKLAYVKELASSILIDGYNYMKCSHDKDIANLCGKTGSDYYESLICPRPETDPDLVCQSARWYFTNFPHEIKMNALDKNRIESFGHLHGFQFRREDMLQEIFDNYDKHGNTPYTPAWGFDSLHSSEPPRGFHLPVCMHDGQSLLPFSFSKPWQHNWGFPAICGNHAANETAEVMKAMGLEPGSPRQHDDPTFLNRIPQLLWTKKTPYTVYMTMCELGLRWPNNYETRPLAIFDWIRTSKDQPWWCGNPGTPDCPDVPYGDRDCGLVRTATSHMTSDEANLWFCTNAGGHTIFERQSNVVWVEELLGETANIHGGHFAHGGAWRNAKYHCRKWLKRGEGQTRQTLEVITGQTLGG